MLLITRILPEVTDPPPPSPYSTTASVPYLEAASQSVILFQIFRKHVFKFFSIKKKQQNWDNFLSPKSWRTEKDGGGLTYL